MINNTAYHDFLLRLKLLANKQPDLLSITLSNVFTMRLIGNKTHGDLAEIAISEFINQYMYDFRSAHVGKELFRAKSHEQDISVRNELTAEEFPISLKAYGDGPLQLSTDKHYSMYPRLELEGKEIIGEDRVNKVLEDKAFSHPSNINVLSLIYREEDKCCNILVFDYDRARKEVHRILWMGPGGKRKHPVYRFYDIDDNYICEVRYGGAGANALQRGLWTNTKHSLPFFDSITNGWIKYEHNLVLVELFSNALIASQKGHSRALDEIMNDLDSLKSERGLT